MTPARITFLIITGIGLLLGLSIGVSNLVDPSITNITLNGEKVIDMTGFWTAMVSSIVPFAIIGLIVAGIVALFTRKKKAKA